jgi:hypothetical protein
MRYARAWAAGSEDGLDWAFRGLTIPEQELASLVRQFASYAATLEQHESIARWTALDAMMSGRFDAGRGALQRLYGVDTTDQDEAVIEFAEHDSAAAARLMRIDSKKLARRVHPVVCNAALSRLRHGDSSGVKAILATMPTVDDRQSARDAASTIRRGLAGQTVMCAQVLRAVLASRTLDGAPVRALLFRADSMMRFTPINYGPFWNYDLALAFARHHEYAAAAAAVRRRFVDAADAPRLVIGLRHEGQWAALAGDTTAAVAAYRQYLMWRSSPNATLVPQRDSVRAELAALERRQRG